MSLTRKTAPLWLSAKKYRNDLRYTVHMNPSCKITIRYCLSYITVILLIFIMDIVYYVTFRYYLVDISGYYA